MDIKNPMAVKLSGCHSKWMSQQMDVTAHGCNRKWMSKTVGCQRQRDVTVNSCCPFFSHMKKWEDMHKLVSAIWHIIAQHMQSAKGLKEAKRKFYGQGLKSKN